MVGRHNWSRHIAQRTNSSSDWLPCRWACFGRSSTENCEEFSFSVRDRRSTLVLFTKPLLELVVAADPWLLDLPDPSSVTTNGILLRFSMRAATPTRLLRWQLNGQQRREQSGQLHDRRSDYTSLAKSSNNKRSTTTLTLLSSRLTYGKLTWQTNTKWRLSCWVYHK